MNYRTELMEQILTNEKAQEIIDYVSQIYGNSYVGLWLFQTIGSVLGPLYNTSEQLMLETSPATSTLLLPYFENEYGIQADPTMSLEQRREVVVAAMRSKGACTPARLADSVSAALGGAPVEIIEYAGDKIIFTEIEAIVNGSTTGQEPDPMTSITNEEIDDLVLNGIINVEPRPTDTGDYFITDTEDTVITDDGSDLVSVAGGPDETTSITYPEMDQFVIYGIALNQDGNLNQFTFIVNIRAAVTSTAPAVAVIERMKPAHLVYTIQGVVQESASTDVTIGVALTAAEHFTVTVQEG